MHADYPFIADTNGVLLIHNSGAVTATTVCRADTAGKIQVHNLSIDVATYGLDVSGVGSSIKGSNVYTENISTWAIRQQDHGHIDVTGGYFDSTKITAEQWDELHLFFGTEDLSGREAYIFTKETIIGTPEVGYDLVVGEGSQYTRGMMVFQYNPSGSVYTDVSATAQSPSGSTFSFPANAIDNALYFGSDLYNSSGQLQHFGLEVNLALQAIVGSGSIVGEYWNGTTWMQFNTMSAGIAGKHYTYKSSDIFKRTGIEQIRYGSGPCLGDWAANDPMASGVNRYWVRFRLTGALTIVPVFEQTKLIPSHSIINEDGWMEYFGKSRPISSLPWDLGLLEPATSSPADQDVYVSDNLSMGRRENRFQDGVVDQQGLVGYLPIDLDTSCPISMKFSFITDDNTAGNVMWRLHWGYTTDGDSVYRSTSAAPTVGPNERIMEAVLPAPLFRDVQATLEMPIDVSELVSRRDSARGDMLWVTMERIGNNALDTHAGDVSIIQLQASYTSWSNGGHK